MLERKYNIIIKYKIRVFYDEIQVFAKLYAKFNGHDDRSLNAVLLLYRETWYGPGGVILKFPAVIESGM